MSHRGSARGGQQRRGGRPPEGVGDAPCGGSRNPRGSECPPPARETRSAQTHHPAPAVGRAPMAANALGYGEPSQAPPLPTRAPSPSPWLVSQAPPLIPRISVAVAEEAPPSWGDLPDSILIRVSAFLPFRADRVHMACVNRQWQAAVMGLRRPPPPVPPQLPWLIFPSTEAPTFYSALGRRYNLPTLDVRRARFCGQILLALNSRDAHALYRLNPGTRIPLPPEFMVSWGAVFPLVVRAATLCAPQFRNQNMAAALVLVAGRCTTAFWVVGRERWLSSGSLLDVTPQDVLFHGGGFFFFITSDEGVAMLWPLEFPDGDVMVSRLDYEDYSEDVGFIGGLGAMRRYLVDSRGRLLMVVRYINHGTGTKMFWAFGFRVTATLTNVKPPRVTWEYVGDELGGPMLFLGPVCIRSFEVAQYDGFQDQESMIFITFVPSGQNSVEAALLCAMNHSGYTNCFMNGMDFMTTKGVVHFVCQRLRFDEVSFQWHLFGIHRISGSLAVSTVIGDFTFKLNKDLPPEEELKPCHQEIIFQRELGSVKVRKPTLGVWTSIWLVIIIFSCLVTKVEAIDHTCPKRNIVNHILPRTYCPIMYVESDYWRHVKAARPIQDFRRSNFCLRDIFYIDCSVMLAILLAFGSVANWRVKFLLFDAKLVNIWIDYSVASTLYHASWIMYGYFLLCSQDEHGKHIIASNVVGCLFSLILFVVILVEHGRHTEVWRYMLCRLLVLCITALLFRLLWTTKCNKGCVFIFGLIGCAMMVVMYNLKWATILKYKQVTTFLNICSFLMLCWCIDLDNIRTFYGCAYIVNIAFRAIDISKSIYFWKRGG